MEANTCKATGKRARCCTHVRARGKSKRAILTGFTFYVALWLCRLLPTGHTGDGRAGALGQAALFWTGAGVWTWTSREAATAALDGSLPCLMARRHPMQTSTAPWRRPEAVTSR